ncbi:MAG: HD domain-containing protein [Bacillota bacterium]
MKHSYWIGTTEEFQGRTWDYRPFIERARQLYADVRESAGLGYRFGHCFRVFNLLGQMRSFPELREADLPWPLLRLAGLFHDAGSVRVFREAGFLSPFNAASFDLYKRKHGPYGREMMPGLLGDLLSLEEVGYLGWLAEVHTDHQQSDLAARALQDADTLDEIGQIVLWRQGQFGGHHDQSIFGNLDFYHGEFRAYLHRAPQILHLESSRRIYAQRARRFTASMELLLQEMYGLDIPCHHTIFPWEYWDRVLAARGWVIDRPKGQPHPRWPELIYPLDYGYIPGVMGGDGAEQDLFVGSTGRELVGAMMTVNFIKGDQEVKLLVGMTDAELRTAYEFMNSDTRMMTGFLVKRYN